MDGDTGPMRVGDADREHAIRQLRTQRSAGRLDDAELDERIGLAEKAKTDVDLEALFRDLPGGYVALPDNRWQQFPGGPSGVDDRGATNLPAVPYQPDPALDRPPPAESRADERQVAQQARRASLVTTASWAVVILGAMALRSWWFFIIGMIVIAAVITPYLASQNRRRRGRRD